MVHDGIFIEDTEEEYWGRGKWVEGLNMLGVMHMELRDSIDLRILVAGTSHAADLDN